MTHHLIPTGSEKDCGLAVLRGDQALDLLKLSSRESCETGLPNVSKCVPLLLSSPPLEIYFSFCCSLLKYE